VAPLDLGPANAKILRNASRPSEEVAFRKCFIGVEGLRDAISACTRSKYQSYLELIADSAS
jgi:hypothetical protein